MFQYSHSGGIFCVERKNVDAGKEVSVHAVHSSHVIKLSGVVEQLTGMSGNKITVDHRSQFEEVHNHTCRRTETVTQVQSGLSLEPHCSHLVDF